MKGEAKDIFDLFWRTTHFIIPIYQRRYSWKIFQCERLFNDIEDACRNGRNHFIGCIISTSDGGRGDYLVIDGQQRITTLSLLLKAAFDLIQENRLSVKNGDLADEALEAFLKNRRGDTEHDKIKLSLLNEDCDDYFRLFESDRRLSADSIIHANYTYFADRLLSSSIAIDDIYETIKNLQVVDITLSHEDNPQLIFESLNSTGLALTEGDKIRNFILMGRSSSEQVKFYREYWSRIESNCGDDDVSGFVRDYLSLKTQRIPNIKAVYQEFRKYWNECGMDAVEILEDLRSYSYAYRKLLGASTGNRLADMAITGLSRLETTVMRPFAIEVIRLEEKGELPSEEMGRVFSIVENYIFRRTICAMPSNGLNKVFATLANDIRRLDGTYNNYVDKLSFVLIRKQGSGRAPSDEEFVSDFKNRKLYGATVSRVIWYVLSYLENSGTLETKDIWGHLERGDYSIEHIMPQTLSDKWANDLGEDAVNIHETWIDRISNLTVIAAPYNSMFSNRPFPEKRDMEHGFKESGLRINQFVASKEKWGVAELEERADVLAATALTIWPGLKTDYQEPGEKEDEVSLDDDFDFTGRRLLSATFDDICFGTMDWADFVVELCKRIYMTDPAKLVSITKNADQFGLGNFLYDREVDHARSISESIYLNTSCDTNRKMWFLRHLFNRLDLDEDSLVMRVSTSSKKEDRAETLRKLWSFIIPRLQEATVEAGCPSYRNRTPGPSLFLDGAIGLKHIHLVSSLGLKSQKVWAYLYIDYGDVEYNTKVYNHFLSHRREIESVAGDHFEWQAPSSKVRRGAILLNASVPFIDDESRWPEVAEVSASLMKTLVSALHPYFEEVKQMDADL